MKKSNFALSVAATFAIGVAVGTTVFTIPSNPTSVSYIPVDDSRPGIVGGGVTFKLPATVTEREAQILQLAHDTAVKDHYKYPQLLQAIVLQETKAGTADKYTVSVQKHGTFYGIYQMELGTVKDILLRYPEIYKEFGFHTRTDDEIKAHLILDDVFSTAVASKYALILDHDHGYKGEKLMVAFNKGPNGSVPESTSYSQGALEKLKSHAISAVYKIPTKG